MLEIESKAKVDNLYEIENKLIELNAKFVCEEFHEDLYFNHACRDFSRTDEALRLRKVGDKVFLTYKGPKIDKKTKTREEFEVEVNNFDNMREILKKLNFIEVTTIRKKRRYFKLREYTVCLDEVENLGYFVEIEKKTGEYNPEELLKLLKKLKAKQIITKSYLEMALERELG